MLANFGESNRRNSLPRSGEMQSYSPPAVASRWSLPTRIRGPRRPARVTHSYGPAGAVTETDAAGVATTLIFDPTGKLAEVTDALGNVAKYQYNSTGKLSKLVAPTGATYSYSYDSLGQLD